MGGALSDRRVLITGAAQGLGLGIARRLAAAGAQLAVTDRDRVILDRAREPIFEAAAIPIVKDLAVPDGAEYVFSQLSQRLGSVNVLVNCAAWSLQKAVGETTVEEFDQLIAINQRAPFFLCQKFVGQLMESDSDPCIINIASVNAIVGNSGLVAYAGTKGALVSMTRALAVEFAPRVRVIAISPGALYTHFTERLIQEGTIDPAALHRKALIPRFITVDELAELVVFLLSPAARSVTGANWVFDGGYTAQ